MDKDRNDIVTNLDDEQLEMGGGIRRPVPENADDPEVITTACQPPVVDPWKKKRSLDSEAV